MSTAYRSRCRCGPRPARPCSSAFAIDADQAAGLLPGQELQPLRLFGHGLLVIAVVNYLDTTIGKYVEFCIGVMVTHGTRRAPPYPRWRCGACTGQGSTSTTCP